jgi:hypothetical protein
MDCSFTYHGPIAQRADPKCPTCQAAVTKTCPTHGKGCITEEADSCAHCQAALGKPCQAHWGIEAALQSYLPDVEPDSLDAYKDAAGKVLAAVKAMKARSGGVRAHFRANVDPSSNTFEFFVSVRTV